MKIKLGHVLPLYVILNPEWESYQTICFSNLFITYCSTLLTQPKLDDLPPDRPNEGRKVGLVYSFFLPLLDGFILSSCLFMTLLLFLLACSWQFYPFFWPVLDSYILFSCLFLTLLYFFLACSWLFYSFSMSVLDSFILFSCLSLTLLFFLLVCSWRVLLSSCLHISPPGNHWVRTLSFLDWNRNRWTENWTFVSLNVCWLFQGYEARVKARNRYGWSDHSQTFYFYTGRNSKW